MGTDFIGYIELNTKKLSDNDSWYNIMDVSIIVNRNYKIFASLFGVRIESSSTLPIAANRGIPKNANTDSYNQLKSEDIVNQSWILYEEIKDNYNNIPISEGDWGWKLVFDTMKSLAKHYGEENVRLIGGFDNYG